MVELNYCSNIKLMSWKKKIYLTKCQFFLLFLFYVLSIMGRLFNIDFSQPPFLKLYLLVIEHSYNLQ